LVAVSNAAEQFVQTCLTCASMATNGETYEALTPVSPVTRADCTMGTGARKHAQQQQERTETDKRSHTFSLQIPMVKSNPASARPDKKIALHQATGYRDGTDFTLLCLRENPQRTYEQVISEVPFPYKKEIVQEVLARINW